MFEIITTISLSQWVKHGVIELELELESVYLIKYMKQCKMDTVI